MSTTPRIAILSFDPLRLELPENLEPTTEVLVCLPPVHIKLFDLSMGGLVPDDPHIGMDAPITNITIILPKPTSVGDIVSMISASASTWRALWLASQKALDNCGPVYS